MRVTIPSAVVATVILILAIGLSLSPVLLHEFMYESTINAVCQEPLTTGASIYASRRPHENSAIATRNAVHGQTHSFRLPSDHAADQPAITTKINARDRHQPAQTLELFRQESLA